MNLDDIYRPPEVLAMEAEIDARIAKERAAKIDAEAQREQDKHIARVIYDTAKETLRKEKLRHKVAEASFVEEKAKHQAELKRHQEAMAEFIEEKAKHRAERDRHLVAVAQFKVDAEPWRGIVRAEQEANRLKEIQDEQDHQAAMIRQKQRLNIPLTDDDEDPIEREERRAAEHTLAKEEEGVQRGEDRSQRIQKEKDIRRATFLKKRKKEHWKVPQKTKLLSNAKR